MTGNKENAGVAFALVCGSGFATALGAAVVFIPSIVKFANQKILACSMSLSAGVMVYVSFVEILTKSHDSFLEAGHGQSGSAFYSVACFFAGILSMSVMNSAVDALVGDHQHPHHDHDARNPRQNTRNSLPFKDDDGGGGDDDDDDSNSSDCSSAFSFEVGCPCHAEDPVGDLDKLHVMAHKMEQGGVTTDADAEPDNLVSSPIDSDDDITLDSNGDPRDDKDPMNAKNRRKLVMTSINTALAISLHNFPEGLATFVATMDNPGVGLVLASAIAIHNIPEGLCVAMPIYFATGNRCKAFLWALLSGASEPIAAVMGYLILAHSFSNTLYGVLFGMVSGMMVIVAIKELLPTARRYDPKDTVVTNAFVIGMGIMAISLVLFVA